MKLKNFVLKIEQSFDPKRLLTLCRKIKKKSNQYNQHTTFTINRKLIVKSLGLLFFTFYGKLLKIKIIINLT